MPDGFGKLEWLKPFFVRIPERAICALLLLVSALNAPMCAGTILRVVVYGHFRGQLRPAKAYSPFELSVISCLLGRLVRLDESGRLRSDIATSWRINASGTVYEFGLDASRGFTAADVRRSLSEALSPAGASLHKTLFSSLLAPDWFTELSPLRLRITLKEPYPAFLYLLSIPEFSVESANKGTIGGLYAAVVKKANREVELHALRGDAKFKNIQVRVVDSLSVIAQAMREAKVDLVLGLPAIAVGALPVVKPYSLDTGQFASPLTLQFNRRSPLTIEDRALIASVFQKAAERWSRGKPLVSYHPHLVPPGLLLPNYYQAKKADALRSAGARIARPIRLWVNTDYVPISYVKDVVAAAAARGVDIQAVQKPFRDVRSKLPEFDLAVVDGGSYFPDPDSALTIWPQILPAFPFPGDALLAQLDKIRHVRDQQQRLESYGAVVSKFESEYWVAPLFMGYDPVVVRDDVVYPRNGLRPFDALCPELDRQ